MQIREGPRRPAPAGGALRSPMSAMMLAMFATMASFYVAGRMWQDAQNRVYLIKELDRRTGQGQSAISVDDTLKVVACRQQGKRLASLEMELAAAKHEGFVGQYTSETNTTYSKKKPLIVIGIMTSFGRKNYRDAIRKSWLPTGSMLKKLEEEQGIVVRFIVGRSANRGDTFDREIDDENRSTKDFLILDNHIESDEELPTKTKNFFANAAEAFDAAFYAKVNDDIYINLDTLSAMLKTHWDKPRVYIGCMKSGEVFSESTHKWYEPDWWKFGDGKLYFRHASGEMFVISRAIAQFISINRRAVFSSVMNSDLLRKEFCEHFVMSVLDVDAMRLNGYWGDFVFFCQFHCHSRRKLGQLIPNQISFQRKFLPLFLARPTSKAMSSN